MLWRIPQFGSHARVMDPCHCPPPSPRRCSDIVGFRAPFLATDQHVRRVLWENKFLYERWGVPKQRG